MRYRDAGVDVGRADSIKAEIGRAVRGTWGAAVRPLPGGFAGVIAWPGGAGAPLLAATMDGVGTKLHLALEAGRVDDAAADLVYHCANDLLCHGARPVAMLDYVAQSALAPDVVQAVVRGLARACAEVGAALLGGETAEMPDTYLPEVVDVAGCMIGSVPAECLLGQDARPGDRLLALASAGLHTNGYSLARKVRAASGLGLNDPLPGAGGVSLGEALLAPHRWYGRALLPEVERGRVHALAHITGGGIAGNLVRVLAEDSRAKVRASSWTLPPLFHWLMTAGGIPVEDAREAFNLGVGMIVACAPEEAEGLVADLIAAGERVWPIGEVVAGPRGVAWS